jgi:hypothetical protein
VQHNLGCGMKTTADRPFADADKAVRKLVEIANATEVVQDAASSSSKLIRRSCGLAGHLPSTATCSNALSPRGWLWRHESSTHVKFTPAGAELFA